MCLSKTHSRASVVEFVKLIDDVAEMKEKLALIQKELKIELYWSTDDNIWKNRDPKRTKLAKDDNGL